MCQIKVGLHKRVFTPVQWFASQRYRFSYFFLLMTGIMLAGFSQCYAQNQLYIDSIESVIKGLDASKKELGKFSPKGNDTLKVKLLADLALEKVKGDHKLAMDNARQSLDLATSIGYKAGIGRANHAMAIIYDADGNYPQALDHIQHAIRIRLEAGNNDLVASSYTVLGGIYLSKGVMDEALRYYLAALRLQEEAHDSFEAAGNYNNIALIMASQNKHEAAIDYLQKAKDINQKTGNKDWEAVNLSNLAGEYKRMGKYAEAKAFLARAIDLKQSTKDSSGLAMLYAGMALVQDATGDVQSAIELNQEAYAIAQRINEKATASLACINLGGNYCRLKQFANARKYLNEALNIAIEINSFWRLSESYSAWLNYDTLVGDAKQAFEHFKLMQQAKDSIVNQEQAKKTVQIQMQYDFDKKQTADSLRFAKEKEVGVVKLQRQRTITYVGYAAVLITLLFLYLVIRNYKKQRLVNKQLRETQAQLVRSEKMAAFGTMANRVSHEILNPLNFINNFSELSLELADEMVNGEDEAYKQHAAELLHQNLQKIGEHGKRAETIVKQLQEHTRQGSAHKFFEET